MSSSSAVLPKPIAGAPCSCGSGKPFEACCEPLLKGLRVADSAEALMRSRFTAHVANDSAYLHRTYAVTASQPFVPDPEGPLNQWTKLIVHSHEPGRTPDVAFVEFSAYFLDQAGEHVLQERSEFRRNQGQWLYTRTVRNGPAPFKSSALKVGRNDPCPCGSGKKFKQCCIAKA